MQSYPRVSVVTYVWRLCLSRHTDHAIHSPRTSPAMIRLRRL